MFNILLWVSVFSIICCIKGNTTDITIITKSPSSTTLAPTNIAITTGATTINTTTIINSIKIISQIKWFKINLTCIVITTNNTNDNNITWSYINNNHNITNILDVSDIYKSNTQFSSSIKGQQNYNYTCQFNNLTASHYIPNRFDIIYLAMGLWCIVILITMILIYKNYFN
nr:ORF129 [Acipenserid herpesvirus 1]